MKKKYLSIDTHWAEDGCKLIRHELTEEEKLEDIICLILRNKGDGHTDGSSEIADFVITLLRSDNKQREEIIQSIKEEDFI